MYIYIYICTCTCTLYCVRMVRSVCLVPVRQSVETAYLQRRKFLAYQANCGTAYSVHVVMVVLAGEEGKGVRQGERGKEEEEESRNKEERERERER